jgi:hypothetical protein
MPGWYVIFERVDGEPPREQMAAAIEAASVNRRVNQLLT